MLETAAQATSLLASLTIVLAIIAYRREIRGQNIEGLFYLHGFLAQERFADARRVALTRLAHVPYAEWTEADKEAAYNVCLSFEEAALLLGGEVLNERARAIMLRSFWGRSVCTHHDILRDFLADRFSPTMTGAEYFPNFMALHDAAVAANA